MLFQSLAEKMSRVFSKLGGKGKLTEADVKAGMREIKLALLEADVNFKVVKEFISRVSERAVGGEVLESLRPENNAIVQQFTFAGIACRDALTSQALIELRRQYCEARKCLYCKIGHRLLTLAAHPRK